MQKSVNSISITPKITEKIINGKRFQEFVKKYSDTNFPLHIIAMTDALSTACFVMGLEDGMAYATEKGVEAIFVTKEKEVYITKGLKKKFRLQADSYSLKKKL